MTKSNKKMLKNSVYLITAVLLIILVSKVYYPHNEEQQVESRQGSSTHSVDQSNHVDKFDLNCTLPTQTSMPRIIVHRVPITVEEAREFALTFTDMVEAIDVQEKSDEEYFILRGSNALTICGKNNFLYTRLGTKPVMKEWSEEEIRQIADEFKDRLLDYMPESNVSVSFDRIGIGWKSMVEGKTIIRTVSVRYKLTVGDIRIIGNGADLSIEICNNTIYGFDVHLPFVSEEGVTVITVTPLEALDEITSRKTLVGELAALNSSGEYAIESVIKEFELMYYHDFLTDKEIEELQPVYYIYGVNIIKNKITGEIKKDKFVELISAIS
jgi:hypothetical protein